jgi:hypothetical protein
LRRLGARSRCEAFNKKHAGNKRRYGSSGIRHEKPPCKQLCGSAAVGSSSVLVASRQPTTGSGCCACAATGHAVDAPPRSDMKPRRFMDRQPPGGSLPFCQGYRIGSVSSVGSIAISEPAKILFCHRRALPGRAGRRHSSTCVGSGSCTKHFELRGRAGVGGEVFGAVRGREREQPFRLVGVPLL